MIIGLNGPIGSGKNTVADILVKKYGFTALGFADKLKISAANLFGIPPALWEELKNKPSARVSLEWSDNIDGFEKLREISITAREFLKRYGTEAHRDVFGYDFWVDALIGSLSPGTNYAIYDARFDNELEKIKQYGGHTIQVRRPGHEFDPTHPSEAPPNPDLIDYTILNNSDLQTLEWYVSRLVESEKLATPLPLDAKDNLFRLPLPPLVPSSSPPSAA